MKHNEHIVPLSNQARSIILGTLLGDGSLKMQKNQKNASLQIRHSDIQREYFFWKANELKEIARKKSVNLQKPDGFSKNHKWRYISQSLPSLTELHHLTYHQNKLYIRRKWLNTLTPLSLAVWWCDDGSLIGYGGRKGVFCTDGFSESSVKVIAHYLNTVWQIRTVVAPTTRMYKGEQRQYWRIWIRSQEELKKFLRIIIPFIPVPTMLSKVILLYKDSQFQQRWISEVVQLGKFSPETVQTEYEKKKSKWNAYR